MTTDGSVTTEPRRKGRPPKWVPEVLEPRKAEMLMCARAGLCRTRTELSRHHEMPDFTMRRAMKADPGWAHEVRIALAGGRTGQLIERGEVPDFVTFRRECFGHETYPHQQEWFDMVERNDLSLILVPPEHSKTMTMSIEYPTWRIAKDRNIRCISISKTQPMARKILMAVKKRLSDHMWYARQGFRSVVNEWGPFAPPGRSASSPWTADHFYVEGIDSAEKDPTMEALGVGGQVYGARADLIICDDIATLKNMQSQAERDKILDWLAQEVLTRLSDDGKLIIVGTRVSEWDIYATLLSEEIEWAQDFSHIVQSAIRDEDTRTVLWPEYWDYDKLVTKRRNRMPTRQWSLVYQQQARGMPDAPFTPEAIERCQDHTFSIGQTVPGVPLVMGVDPAVAGTAAICVVAFDRGTHERWLIDIIARANIQHPEVLKQLIVDTAYRYRPVRCRIEKNAMQGLLSRDPDLRRRLLAAGTQLEEEYTTAQNKYDPEWGVASVAAQFDQGMWHLPAGPTSDHRMRPFIEELESWRPGAKVRQDRVMALWFAELSARALSNYRPGLPTTNEAVPAYIRDRTVPRWVRNGY